jgi:elongation factor G
MAKCEPVLLEPILAVDVSVPSETTSKALQLVTQKRGQILGYDAREGWSGWDRISAHIPLAEMHDLIVNLRSLSQGIAFFEWTYDHLNPMPDKQAETVVAQRQEASHTS